MEIIPFLYVQAKQPNQEGSDYPYKVLTAHMCSSKYTTVVDPDFQIKGGRSSRPWDGGGGLNNFFWPFEPQFGLVAKCYFRNKKKRSMLIVIIEKKIITSADHQTIGQYQYDVYHNVSTVYYQSSPGKKFDSSGVD